MKALVVYYSVSGSTELVARDVQKLAGGDIEKIEDHVKRSGIIGFIRSGYQASTGKTPEIDPLSHDPGDYDVVVIATPIWASKICPPVMSFIRKYGTEIKKPAFIITHAAADNDYLNLAGEIEKKLGKEAAGTLSLTTREAKEGGSGKIKAFAEKILNA